MNRIIETDYSEIDVFDDEIIYETPKEKIEEVWKDVVGYEGLYKVSNLGRVFSTRGIGKMLTP